MSKNNDEREDTQERQGEATPEEVNPGLEQDLKKRPSDDGVNEELPPADRQQQFEHDENRQRSQHRGAGHRKGEL